MPVETTTEPTTLSFTVTLSLDVPRETRTPTLEEFAAAMSGIAYHAMNAAHGRGFAVPAELPTPEHVSAFLRGLVPDYDGTTRGTYTEGPNVTVHV